MWEPYFIEVCTVCFHCSKFVFISYCLSSHDLTLNISCVVRKLQKNTPKLYWIFDWVNRVWFPLLSKWILFITSQQLASKSLIYVTLVTQPICEWIWCGVHSLEKAATVALCFSVFRFRSQWCKYPNYAESQSKGKISQNWCHI